MGVKIGRKDGVIRTELPANDHAKITGTRSSFMDMLKQESRGNNREKMEKLFIEIDKLGARLAEDLSLMTLKEYRESISKFVYLALRGSYEVKDQTGIDLYGSTRSYKIAKKVDESLEELAQIMLKKHEAQLEIVARVSEIRGLLIDLIG